MTGTIQNGNATGRCLATTDITLTPKEAQLRNLLLDVARYIDESKEIKECLELRFAGGWVRDKLLGIQSHDIDTAINAMTGLSFGQKLKEFLEQPDTLQKHGLSREDVGNLHRIAANPEKSKHLETVTTKVLGFDVDFVNLRKEVYAADSRTPQVEFGTAQEDALRRDATVNALFYNLHTRKVEDFIGGLADMERKLIRTPLEPFQTFMDDPLRVLRLVRFASRLEFSIHPDAEACMNDPAVLSALKFKISRERMGIEVEKMLQGQHPQVALQFFDRLGLYSTVFSDPTSQADPQPCTSHWKNAYDCLGLMRQNHTPGSLFVVLVASDEAVWLSWLLAALSPCATIPTETGGKGGRTPPPYAAMVAREGLKMSNHVSTLVTGACRHRAEIADFKRAVTVGEVWTCERDKLGMAIRRWDANGGNWKLQVLLAILVEAMHVGSSDGYARLFQGWQRFIDHLQDMDVLNAPSRKRLVDGTQLAKALGVRPGKWMAEALDVCMAWQFRNPDTTDMSGAVEEVRTRAKDLGIPLGA